MAFYACQPGKTKNITNTKAGINQKTSLKTRLEDSSAFPPNADIH
jgi:hypothetical protein